MVNINTYFIFMSQSFIPLQMKSYASLLILQTGWKWSAEDCEDMVEALVCESHIGQESVFFLNRTSAKGKAISAAKNRLSVGIKRGQINSRDTN